MKACSNCGSIEFRVYKLQKFFAMLQEDGTLKLDDSQSPDYTEYADVTCVKCDAEYSTQDFKDIKE